MAIRTLPAMEDAQWRRRSMLVSAIMLSNFVSNLPAVLQQDADQETYIVDRPRLQLLIIYKSLHRRKVQFCKRGNKTSKLLPHCLSCFATSFCQNLRSSWKERTIYCCYFDLHVIKCIECNCRRLELVASGSRAVRNRCWRDAWTW